MGITLVLTRIQAGLSLLNKKELEMARDSINVQCVRGSDGQMEYIVKMNRRQFEDFVDLIRKREKIKETANEIYERELAALPVLGSC